MHRLSSTLLAAVYCLAFTTANAAAPAEVVGPPNDPPVASCFYCTKDDRLARVGIEICELPFSTVYLFRNQIFPGRCAVAFKGHKRELHELTKTEREGYMADVARVSRALEEVYHPDKINYAVFGDEVSHLHFHVVPKFRTSPQWKQSFPSATDTKVLSEKEYADAIAPIAARLRAGRDQDPSPR